MEVTVLSEITELYKETRKKDEHAWTMYFTRPFAAVLVHLLRSSPVTPNQVTVLAFLTSLVGAAVLVFWLDYWGLLVGVLIYQAAYVLDCVDGQLARVRGIASPIGHLLDFMLDEAKAKVLLAAVTVRLFLLTSDSLYLLAGLGGLVLVSIALTLTTFTRRPEYPKAPGAAPPGPVKVSPLRMPVRVAEWASQELINYPTYIVFLAIADSIEVYFWAYIAVYLLYTARTFAMVVLKLARPGFLPQTGDDI
jgi:phosphatidylglycerophosphate synthase